MWTFILRVGLTVGIAISGTAVANATEDVAPIEFVPNPDVLDESSPEPPVEWVNMPADLKATTLWALALYEAAELELPRIRFEHHADDNEACFGRIGSHLPDGDVSVINLCTTDIIGAVEVMIVHEIAHAWAEHSLEPEPKAAFKELRGWEHWRDYNAAPWHENGTEQAAEFLVWGLLDRPYSMVRIYHSGCDELEAGYETLTGSAPLHGYRDKC